MESLFSTVKLAPMNPVDVARSKWESASKELANCIKLFGDQSRLADAARERVLAYHREYLAEIAANLR